MLGLRRKCLVAVVALLFVSACGQDEDDGLANSPDGTEPSTGGPMSSSGDTASGPDRVESGTSDPTDDAASPGRPAPAPPAGESGDASGSDGFAPGDSASSPEPGPVDGNGQGQAGTLTAGSWDDNLNYERFTEYRGDLQQDRLPGLLPTTDEEHDAAHETFSGDREANTTLDVALVIDTTGSMTDEIGYLQTEFNSLAQRIGEAYPDAEQRWALVVYRDDGDAYEVRYFDFRTDVEDFRSQLAAQSADGGGDFPEAPHAALETMAQLDWRDAADTARLAFWVADAPHHNDRADDMAEALRAAQALDVHIYPVASSGIDELTELTMRSAAQLTGGRYLFLTDDSGVGGAHKEPSLPCYFVTRLDHAILRMVDIEMTGQYRQPDNDNIIRKGGDPKDGACILPSGEELQVF